MSKASIGPEHFNDFDKVYLPSHMGIVITDVQPGSISATMKVEQHHLAPNGYLHAGSVVTLADTAAGYGCVASLPEGAQSFTTIELKSNFLGTAREGSVVCEAELSHGGRTTQVWDAVVKAQESGKTIAMFRCTQMILYPR
ncbi:MAG: PaaI family thioesterase [Pseudohongiellaceae bacterium]|nr:PaaI family thioesterase [Pseudohongiellaceae bacterium]